MMGRGEGGGRETIPNATHCQHEDDFCIKMGSDGSRFTVSIIVRDKVSRLSTNHSLFEEKREPKQNRAAVPLTRLTPHR